jgi:serine/threonine-protein kinase RsbW
MRQLTVPACPSSIDAIHDLVASMMQQPPPLSAQDQIRCQLAVMEIASNVIAHAVPPPPGGTGVTIQITITFADRITARFRDNATPAQIDLLAVRMPDELAEQGRGIAITQTLGDELDYQRSGSANVWTLTCHYQDPV